MTNIVVMTSDKRLDAVPGFAHQFNKYWSSDQEVVVAGFTAPQYKLPANFTFLSLGAQDDYPFARWSDALIRFMHLRPDWERFVIMLEDYYLVRHVNIGAIEHVEQYMIQHPEVLKFDLCAERLYAAGSRDIAYYNFLDIIKSDYGSQYHFSLWTGMWSRQQLLRVTISGESPHDMEITGTTRLAQFKDDISVLGSRQWPMRHITIYKHGVEGVNTEGMRQTDIDELRAKGMLP